MIILRHNTLEPDKLFIIERLILKKSEGPYEPLSTYSLLNKPKEEVYGYISGIFKRMGVCQILGITISDFLDFLIDIEKLYFDNPYHSFYHGVDVSMILYHLIIKYKMNTYLNPVDIIILMLAGLCHDIAHPGNNNQFEVNCKTSVAKKYNNLSVLESQSAAITLDLLDKHQLLNKVNKTSREYFVHPISIDQFKSSIVQMILATDMACHFNLKDNIDLLHRIIQSKDQVTLRPLFKPDLDPFFYFMKHMALTKSTSRSDSIFSSEERQMLCNILLHAADISNPCRPWSVFYQFSRLVCVEFFNQGQKELAKGLAISPNMDPSTQPAHINAGFIDFIVQPYFESLSQLFPAMKVLVKTCARNRKEWMKLSGKSSINKMELLKPEKIYVTISAGTIDIPQYIEQEILKKKRKKKKKKQRNLRDDNPTSHMMQRRKSESVVSYNNDCITHHVANPKNRRNSEDLHKKSLNLLF